MADDLHDELTNINGIGDARADEIIDVIDTTTTEESETPAVRELLEDAIEHFDDSMHADVTAQQGMTRVRRAKALLDD